MRHFVYYAVTEKRPPPDEVPESSPALKSWMVYALAFSIVYSLIAWPCVIIVCGKTEQQSDAESSKAYVESA